MKPNNTVHLITEMGKKLGETPWNIYPRPQLKRDSFFCLNGRWDFAAANSVPKTFDETILVPFPPQSLLSGIGRTFNAEERLYYRRFFTLPNGFIKDKVLLNIGAADQVCRAYINGNFAGEHAGGYNAFSLDITPFLINGKNEILIEVQDDPQSTLLPYGKQKENRGGMWYTPVAGIWQSVWLESVPEEYIQSIKITTENAKVTIDFEGISAGELIVKTPDGEQFEKIANSTVSFSLKNPQMWSPENPYLYRFSASNGADFVVSYFALRDLEIAEIQGVPRLLLNGKPYFFHGLLDQGYFSDGIYTPASPECFKDDILAMKNMGFNMLRKHIKVEPEQFYYECDKLGMIVFQDMVNNGDYSFLRDTALPTIGIQKSNDKRLHKDPATREAFKAGMAATVSQLYNHPCICQWTIFNEGWGQFCSSEMYDLLRTMDTSRFIDSASGWFKGGKTDLESPHIYFKPVKLKASMKPIFLSEFGGYSCNIEGHCFNPDNVYGYRNFDNTEQLAEALEALYLEQIIPAIRIGLCGTVYTQVSDVEDETNGLLTYDRAVQKIPTQRMKAVSDAIFAEFNAVTGQ